MNRIISYSMLKYLRKKLHNKRIVLGTGCFDIIHNGHLHFLREARIKGDILVIGINSDKSIQIIKGANRPIINEHDRCRIISAFRHVDYVFVFEEIAANKSILMLRPDIFAIGEEGIKAYPEEIETAKKVGAAIHTIDRIPSVSTSSIINDIRIRGTRKNRL